MRGRKETTKMQKTNHVCKECVRFRGNKNSPQRYNCSSHEREDSEVTETSPACSLYWDNEEYKAEKKREEEERAEKIRKLHEETKNNPPVKLQFVSSYDYRTDKIIPLSEPECPYCGEMPYSLEECVFCGTKFLQEDADLVKYKEINTGKKQEIMKCQNCGHNTLRVSFFKQYGRWQVAHGECSSCGLRYIV